MPISYCRLSMVRHLRVTLPKQMYNLASFQPILDSFPNLQDLVLELPYYNLHLPDLLTVAKLLNNKEEVPEEEVTAANHLLDLLADRDRRGRLRGVKLPKVAFTDWLPKIKMGYPA